MGKKRFHKDPVHGVYKRTVDLPDGGCLNLEINQDIWCRKTSLAVNKWIQRNKDLPHTMITEESFRWGNILIIRPCDKETIGDTLEYRCESCGILYKSRSGLYRHTKRCKAYLDKAITNIRETTTTTNVNVQINNNIQVRNLGEENPQWLTSKILNQVLADIGSAIPRLMEKKHFNDDFPENKNIRVTNLRDMNKFLQVFEGGRWRIRDSKYTFYRVINEIYDVLSEALTDEVDSDDDTISEQVKLTRRSQRFIEKVNKIRPMWEKFEEGLTNADPKIMDELWKDLKILLMDRQLAIEQGVE